MDLLSNLEHQLSQLVDCLDYVGLVGLAYLAVRWRRYLKSQGRALLTVLAVPALYVLVVTAISALTKVAGAERYYRPVVPLLLVGAGAGFWCASRDFCRKGVGRAIGIAAIGISLLWILKTPLRAHRSPQTRAGKWLARNDLSYTGPVFSDYSQPVYYTGMRYVPTGPVGRRLYRRLKSRGLEVKYFILEHGGDNGAGWAHRLVQEGGWRRVYYDARRGLSIYLNPLLDGPGTAPDGQSEPARFSEALPGRGHRLQRRGL